MVAAKLQINFLAAEPVRLPRFAGAVFRGGFGLAFRRVTCPFPTRECDDCLLKEKCVWTYVFNTPRPATATIMRKYETVPHPFVLEPLSEETEYPAGADLSFNLILIGRATEFLPYFVLTCEQMATQGLGPGRPRLKIRNITQDGTILFDATAHAFRSPLRKQRLHLRPGADRRGRVKLNFLTPTRINYAGRMCRRIDFHILIRSLLRRLGLLAYFHDQPVELDYAALIKQAQEVKTTEMHLSGYEWRRYSGRQEREVEMEGMTGTVTYEGNIGPFLPFLRAGELLHVGKGTTFGMGKYELEVG